jgi:hypothetical protein
MLFADERDVLNVDFSLSPVASATQTRFLTVGTVIRSGRTLTTCCGEVYGVEPDGERTVVEMIQATLMAVTRPSEAQDG